LNQEELKLPVEKRVRFLIAPISTQASGFYYQPSDNESSIDIIERKTKIADQKSVKNSTNLDSGNFTKSGFIVLKDDVPVPVYQEGHTSSQIEEMTDPFCTNDSEKSRFDNTFSKRYVTNSDKSKLDKQMKKLKVDASRLDGLGDSTSPTKIRPTELDKGFQSSTSFVELNPANDK
jgi:hypothetical protein